MDYVRTNICVLHESMLDKLDRLNDDYVNEYFGAFQDEAYEEGRKAGIEEAIKWSKGNEEDAYEAGLNDAWNLAKKLYSPLSQGVLSAEEIRSAFGCEYLEVIHKYSAKEALDKLKAYEKAQRTFHVGDVIEDNFGIVGIITKVGSNLLTVLTSDGAFLNVTKIGVCRKLKHVSLEELFNQIGGDKHE